MKTKNKIILSVAGTVVSLALLTVSAFLAESGLINSTVAVVLVAVSVLLVLLAIFYASKTDYETGVYECRKCGYTFKPTIMAYIWGAHTPTARHLKCPKCEEKSWCIRKNILEDE